MSAALTFGSVGDIIALCQIAWKLAEALGTGPTGAGAEYRELRETLDRLIRVLTTVVTTHQHRNGPPSNLNDIERDILALVNECGGLIQDALTKLSGRYGQSLSQSGVRNVLKKIGFSIRDRKEAENLRNKLSERMDSISLLSGLAAKQSAQVDTASIIARIDRFHETSARQGQACESLVVTTRHQSRELRAIKQRVEDVASASQVAQVSVYAIQALLMQMVQGLVSLQAFFFGWLALCSPRLDPTSGLPVRLEDPMGSVLELPFDCLYGWRDLDYIIRRRFEALRLKGYEKILRRQYALEDDCSGRDLDRSRPPKAWLRRGMKVNMSMIFATGQHLTRDQCPRCQMAVVTMEEVTVQCKTANCGMWFRVSASMKRVREVEDDTEDDGTGECQQRPRGKRSRTDSGDAMVAGCEPSDFQRVRLLKAQPETEVTTTSIELGTPLEGVGIRCWRPRFRVWYCCRCGDGPLNSQLIVGCTVCVHHRCRGCEGFEVVDRETEQGQ
ncbi:hypothetical protein GGTG_07186 [Gaeumannomyces tritici R3-111a-1]|uniref:Ubiquitin-like domain-containing protein n=1 Tax=Gaeumannomyces tritici (strain R3-111a-1) TaxID=644352 RepID=J3P0Z0_GAET3|nr:hypothetical protein GGTG_07186 [Gaeumannomyces tritici R3-111a-1]EJT77274.1 hypothetical protein GGTG_07186 [Gaeumannomyces tritici R3-111a-1]